MCIDINFTGSVALLHDLMLHYFPRDGTYYVGLISALISYILFAVPRRGVAGSKTCCHVEEYQTYQHITPKKFIFALNGISSGCTHFL